MNEGRPDVADLLKNEQIDFIINTTEGRKSIEDSSVVEIGSKNKVFCSTTLAESYYHGDETRRDEYCS